MKTKTIHTIDRKNHKIAILNFSIFLLSVLFTAPTMHASVIHFGPIADPTGFGPIADPTGYQLTSNFGPIADPTGFGPIADPTGFGPIADPTGFQTWSTSNFGPIADPTGHH